MCWKGLIQVFNSFLRIQFDGGVPRWAYVQDNARMKCSQEQNVCLSHLENEALDFDVKQAKMGGGCDFLFYRWAPHFESLFLLACGTSPVLLPQLYESPRCVCLCVYTTPDADAHWLHTSRARRTTVCGSADFSPFLKFTVLVFIQKSPENNKTCITASHYEGIIVKLPHS